MEYLGETFLWVVLQRSELLATTDTLGQSVNQADVFRPILHIIGYSHIDAACLWPWRDGSNLVLTTAISALDRMKDMPGFRYSHWSAIHYRGIEKADSDMFAEILRRIREGRWKVVGGWPVEPDCNITESFDRLTNNIVLKNYDVGRYL